MLSVSLRDHVTACSSRCSINTVHRCSRQQGCWQQGCCKEEAVAGCCKDETAAATRMLQQGRGNKNAARMQRCGCRKDEATAGCNRDAATRMLRAGNATAGARSHAQLLQMRTRNIKSRCTTIKANYDADVLSLQTADYDEHL